MNGLESTHKNTDFKMKTLEDYGIRVPEILLPLEKHMSTWPVIACDQYTQDQLYWDRLIVQTTNKPSTLNLILPEIYLNDHKEERIDQIRRTMTEYLNGDIFLPAKKCFVYVERTTPFGRLRRGLVALIDLDKYDWSPFSRTNIRATEETIVSRIPPRVSIRKGAPLETPHIMLLVDDKQRLLVERTGTLAKENNKKPLYDIELMCGGGGSIKGWGVEKVAEIKSVLDAVEKVASAKTQSDGSVFLFAVGDGNHSLATAKAVWEEYKIELREKGQSEGEINENPVKWALVEIVNIYDEGLNFEPIHRVVFGADSRVIVDKLKLKLGGEVVDVDNDKDLIDAVKNSECSFGFAFSENNVEKFVLLRSDVKDLAVSALQPALDAVLDEFALNDSKKRPVIDYIHGADEVVKLGVKKDATGILMPPVLKDKFFDTISSRGPLPNKSFSLGEADEKRFYLECRKLFPLNT